MKVANYIFSATVLALLAGCSGNEISDPAEITTKRVEISLGSHMAGLQQEGRSVVSPGQQITTMLIGREGSSQASATQTWTASGSFSAGDNKAEISIAPKQYYSDELTAPNTYILGVYPTGTLQGNKVIFTSMDGEQDILLSGWVDAGNKTANKAPEGNTGWTAPAYTLTFEHMTSQLYFEARTAPNTQGENFDVPVFVQGITVRNVQIPSAVSLIPPAAEFTSPANLSIPGVPSVGLSTTPVVCGRPLMLNQSAELVVDITLSVDGAPMLFNGVTLKDAANPNANLATAIGKRHKVTLTFTAPDKEDPASVKISATATVKDWEDGSSGSVIM